MLVGLSLYNNIYDDMRMKTVHDVLCTKSYAFASKLVRLQHFFVQSWFDDLQMTVRDLQPDRQLMATRSFSDRYNIKG